MEKIVSTFLFCSCFVIQSVFGQSTGIDITSYDIRADCDLNKRVIDIIANLNVDKTVNSSSIKILLGSWVQIKSIKSVNVKLQYSRKSSDSHTLIILISEQFKNDNKINLSFEYTLPLDSLDSQNNNLIFIQNNTLWYPLLRNDISSMKLNVIAPDNFSVFTVGDLINKKNINNNNEYYFENKQNNKYGLYIIKSDTFSTTLTKIIENININFFFVSKDTITNNKIINEICKSFSFYTKYIGSYKYKQFNVVEIPDNRIMFAQSLSSLILVGSPFLSTYKLDYGNWPAHEVAHQWWGSGLFTDNKAKCGLFLEESINEYFKAIYIENTLGVDSLKSLLKSYLNLYNDIDKMKELPILEITNVSTMENGYIIYQKGPLVVNKLKNLMGAETYQNFIKEIYVTYYGKFLSYDDFINVLSKYDTKSEFIYTLNKWLSETGYTE